MITRAWRIEPRLAEDLSTGTYKVVSGISWFGMEEAPSSKPRSGSMLSSPECRLSRRVFPHSGTIKAVSVGSSTTSGNSKLSWSDRLDAAVTSEPASSEMDGDGPFMQRRGAGSHSFSKNARRGPWTSIDRSDGTEVEWPMSEGKGCYFLGRRRCGSHSGKPEPFCSGPPW